MTAPTFEDGAWYWVEKEGWIGDPPTIAPALYKAQSDAWYSFAFSGIPTREVKVLEACRRAPAVPKGWKITGLEAAFGRPVDIAINHDPEALAMHALNRPGRGACTRQLRPRSGLYAAPGLIGNSHAASPCQTAIIEAGAFAYTRT